MIKEFKDTPCLKNSGIIYEDTFKSAKELYELDPVRGGELAMAILEVAMTGDYSSDDAMFKIHLLHRLIRQIRLIRKRKKKARLNKQLNYHQIKLLNIIIRV